MKNTKLPSLVSVLILTVLTSIVWVTLSIYWSIKKSPEPSVTKEVSDPLTPTLNTKVMGAIESKLFFNDNEIPQLNLVAKSTPIPIATQSAIASPTASASATPTASGSATPQ